MSLRVGIGGTGPDMRGALEALSHSLEDFSDVYRIKSMKLTVEYDKLGDECSPGHVSLRGEAECDRM